MGPDSEESRASSKKGSFFLLLLLILSLWGCAHEPAPDLLEIDHIDPPAIEQGSELRVEGMGFAEHRPGTLTLRGTLHAAGRAPRAIAFSALVEPDTQSLTVLRMKETHISAILAGAQHGTFVGSVEISFDPVTEGRPILRGEREHVTLNFFGKQPSAVKSPAPFEKYLGLRLSPSFVIEAIEKDKVAAGVGLKIGDRLLSLDGVQLDALSDFVPTPHLSTSLLTVAEQGSSAVRDVQLPRADFQLLDVALTAQGLALALGFGLSLLFVARPPRFAVWILGAKRASKKQPLSWLSGVTARDQLWAYPIFALVSVLYFLVLAGALRPLLQLDFLLCLSCGVFALLLGSFLLGGTSNKGRFSLLVAFGSTSTTMFMLLPVVIAALCRSAEVGSLHLVEIDSAQSVLPPHWGGLQSPWSLLLAIGYILALIPLSGRRPPVFGKQGESHRALLFGRAMEWLGTLLLQALWISLFWGAQLAPAQHSLVFRVAYFCCKLAALAYLLAVLRARSGYIRSSEAFSLWGSANILQSLLCASLLVLSWTHWFAPLTVEITSNFALALGASLLVLVLVAQTRSWVQCGRRGDPWI